MNDEGRLILLTRSKQNLCVRYEPALPEKDGVDQGWYALGRMGAAGFRVPMACLGGEPYAEQQWYVDAPCLSEVVRVHGGIEVSCSYTDNFLFATVSMADGPLEEHSFLAYQALLGVLQTHGKSHLLRIWNYVPHINALDAGVERYQLFNSGRKKAFQEHGYTVDSGAPAACALGTHTGRLMIAALAGVQAVSAIENPRQVSSYRYPKEYGVDAPIFSRAAWLQQASGDDVLFVSGTASIVGHQTMHLGDTLSQLKESVRNIEAVLESANARAGRPLWSLGALQGRVYLRHAQDYPMVQDYLATRGMVQFCFMHADVCRKDLMVEIEAEGLHRHAN